MMKATAVLAALTFVLAVGCRTGSGGTSASATKDITDADPTKPPVQLPNGNYLVSCKNGTQEERSWAQIVGNQVCEANTQGHRCECRDNNGPDLMQVGFNTDTGATLWETKIGGWDNNAGNWTTCWQTLRTSEACRLNDHHEDSFFVVCSCDDDNGPDLNYTGFRLAGGTPLWKTKINGWNAVQGAFDQCWTATRSEPLCVGHLPPQLGRRCECVNNNGPDLMQIIYDRNSNATMSRVKIMGWNASQSAFNDCYAQIQSSPSCN